MARLLPMDFSSEQGSLVVEELFPNCVEVFYVPPDEKLSASGLDPNDAMKHKAKLLIINGQDDFITIYPTNTLSGYDDFLKPKYDQITSITLEGFEFGIAETEQEVMEILEELPSGFVKDFDYGLGLLKEYRFVIDAVVEHSNCSDILISKNAETAIDETGLLFTIAFNDFDDTRKALNRITERARRSARAVKDVVAFNQIAVRLGVEQKQLQWKNDAIHRMIAVEASETDNLSESDQHQVLKLLSSNKRVIAESQPDKLVKLQNDIELVSLERLIETYDEMIGKRLSENRWQNLFNENPFILNLAFGYPIIKVQDQASVGGRKLSGSGDKISDFLVKNTTTNNIALFEIKTPSTKLLNKNEYRDGVFTPSADLSGSINQALDQRYKLQKEITSLKENSRTYDLETYSVHCVLIVGQTPDDVDKQKSFELFRRNSKDVEIVTFDELLGKLKQLHEFLSTAQSDNVDNGSGEIVPESRATGGQ